MASLTTSEIVFADSTNSDSCEIATLPDGKVKAINGVEYQLFTLQEYRDVLKLYACLVITRARYTDLATACIYEADELIEIMQERIIHKDEVITSLKEDRDSIYKLQKLQQSQTEAILKKRKILLYILTGTTIAFGLAAAGGISYAAAR